MGEFGPHRVRREHVYEMDSNRGKHEGDHELELNI